jgi:outer membrane protein OmpA-like peptidoglycan-associated protein
MASAAHRVFSAGKRGFVGWNALWHSTLVRPTRNPSNTKAHHTLRSLLLFVSLTSAAHAEVTINPQALDQQPAPLTAAPPAPAKRPPHPPAHAQAARPAAPPAARKPPLIVPPAPPPVPVLQPLNPPPPAHPLAAPDPAPIVENAKGEVVPIAGGIRVTFGSGSADLNKSCNDALRQLARETPGGIFNVIAVAAGVPDDPSTPRRLSLSRALAARSLLIAEGVKSTQIYVRALGANAGDGPADRVDVTVTVPPAPSTASLTPASPAPARTPQ